MTLDLGGRAEERALLTGFLDWNRAVVEHKVGGLAPGDAHRVMTPTGLSPLGVIAHLIAVEIAWFDETFAGNAVDPIWDDYGSFRPHPEDTAESLITEYQRACARSREICNQAPSLDDLSARATELRGNVSLRWICVHVIAETARHAGHLDIMREAIDGRTGD